MKNLTPVKNMKTIPHRTPLCVLGSGLLLGVSCITLYADTTTWTSTSSADFTSATNWSSGSISSGSAVLANNDSVVHALTYSGSSLTIASLSIDNTGVDYSIGGSGMIAISNAAGIVVTGGGVTSISPDVWFQTGGVQTINSGSTTLTLAGIRFSSSSNALNLVNSTPLLVSGTVQSYGNSRSLQLTGAGGSMTINGVVVDNTGSITTGIVLQTGFTGVLTLNGVNTYTGATKIYNGKMVVNGSLANTAIALGGAILTGSGTIGGATVVTGGTISGSLTFNNTVSGTNATINGSGLTLGATTLHGTSTLSGANTASSVTIADGTTTLSGTTTGGFNVSSGATLAGSGNAKGTVVVTSATINGSGLTLGATTLHGTSALSGTNSASSLTIADGTTTLSGTTQSISTLSVSAEATLNANGTIAGSASVGGLLKGNSTVTGNLALTSGTLAPGNSAGITAVEGNFTVDHNSILVAEVSGTGAGISYDQVKVMGSVSLDGTLDLSTLSGLNLGDTITLIDNTGTGATSGYFSTILAGGTTYTLTSNANYKFIFGSTEYLLSFSSNADGDANSNDVTLTVVPEPNTWAMLVGGVGMLAFGQCLRRRRGE